MTTSYLPAVAQPPHDPFHIRLDRRAGWRQDTSEGLTSRVAPTPDDGSLSIQPSPDSGPLLNDPSGSFGGVTWPDHLAPLPGGGLALLDREEGRLLRLDPCTCRFEEWPCLGSEPGDPRRPLNPGSIAVACAQLYLCDTGHQRVLVLSLASGTVRATWHSPSLPGLALWQPEDVALSSNGEVFVSDPANGGIHVFSTYGTHRRFIAGLGAVRSLAVDCHDRLYVRIDAAPHVIVLDSSSGRILEEPARPEEVADRFAALPVRVLAGGAADISALCKCPPHPPMIVDHTGDPTDGEAHQTSFPKQGVWISKGLDSEITRCTWHRITLGGSLPPGSKVQVLSCTAESEVQADLLALKPDAEWSEAGTWRTGEDAIVDGETDFLLSSPPGRYLWLKLVFTGTGFNTPRLTSLEVEFPRISLRRYLPAIFGAEPVAADFTDRWLAIFDRTFRDIESTIDNQAQLFDPLACPATPPNQDFLSWLAGWVGVTLERNWSEARRRAYLKYAPRLFPWRGTVTGMRQSLYLLLGLERWLDHTPGRADCVPCPVEVPAGWRPPRLILEHYQLRRWMFLGEARLSDNAKLWGESIVNRSRLGGPNEYTVPGAESGAQLGTTQLKKTQDPCRDPFHEYAHKLSVFVPASCVREPSTSRALERLVKTVRPAHVQANVIPVEPRFRVGVQAMLGLDAVIGWQPQPVDLGSGSLGRATVLTSAIDNRPRLRVGAARIAENTVLP